jgi:hypothetical protein
MKIQERTIVDGDKVTFHTSHDVTPALERAAMLRSSGAGVQGNNRLVGSIPFALIEAWANEAGVALTDTEAVRELMHKKILSGEFNKFRVWGGRY